MSLRFRDLQLKLQKYGYYSGRVDGLYGPLSRKAIEAWASTEQDLDANLLPPGPGPGLLVPQSWMPNCVMKRIIFHWTAGGPNVSEIDLDDYHIIVDQDNRLTRGNESIADNVSTADGDYAPHVRGLNSGSIGVALTGMMDAEESPFKPGPYPIKLDQWRVGARVVAELAAFYNIAVTPTTILQHGEVQANLGVAQRGKWDVMVLPWEPTLPPAQVANLFRAEVRKHLGG